MSKRKKIDSETNKAASGGLLEPLPKFDREDMGDDDYEVIYSAVGRALTQWQKLEAIVGHVFLIMVPSRNGGAAAMYSRLPDREKFDAVKEAASLVLVKNEALNKKLSNCIKCINQLRVRRNEIAHGIVFGPNIVTEGNLEVVDGKLVNLNDKNIGYFLVPNYHHKIVERQNKYRKLSNIKLFAPIIDGYDFAYNSTQINRYSENFAQFYWEMVDLLHEINSYCESEWPRKSLLPEVGP